MDGQEKALRAVVAAVQITGMSDLEFNSSVNELRELAKALGLELAGTFMQKRNYFQTIAIKALTSARKCGVPWR